MYIRGMVHSVRGQIRRARGAKGKEGASPTWQRWRFTDLGALLLQQEVRLLQTRLSDLASGHSVRPQFTALSQHVALLNLERRTR